MVSLCVAPSNDNNNDNNNNNSNNDNDNNNDSNNDNNNSNNYDTNNNNSNNDDNNNNSKTLRLRPAARSGRTKGPYLCLCYHFAYAISYMAICVFIVVLLSVCGFLLAFIYKKPSSGRTNGP